jgi:hypothetical protein
MHEAAARKALHTWLSTPDGAQLLHKVYTGVRQRWDRQWLDALGQHYIYSGNGEWPAEQIVCFGKLHIRIEEGKIGIVQIGTGAEPGPDAARARNAVSLADLPEPFTAEVHQTQHGADSDGVLRWDRPIEVDVATGRTETSPDGETRSVMRRAVLRPGSLPLEIGDSLPSRTLLHALEDRGVARWPYGQPRIWLFADVEMFKMADVPVELVPAGVMAV